MTEEDIEKAVQAMANVIHHVAASGASATRDKGKRKDKAKFISVRVTHGEYDEFRRAARQWSRKDVPDFRFSEWVRHALVRASETPNQMKTVRRELVQARTALRDAIDILSVRPTDHALVEKLTTALNSVLVLSDRELRPW